jgi:hypothetical protein
VHSLTARASSSQNSIVPGTCKVELEARGVHTECVDLIAVACHLASTIFHPP